jgi:signal transduction histidine kinase
MSGISKSWLALLGAAVLPIAICATIAVTPLGETALMPLMIAGGIASAGVALVAFMHSRKLSKVATVCERLLGDESKQAADEFDCIARTLVALDQKHKMTLDRQANNYQAIAVNLGKLGTGSPATEILLQTESESDSEANLVSTYREALKRITSLRQRQASTAKLLQEIPTAILAVDDAGLIRFANTAAEKIFAQGALVKRSIATVIATGDEPSDPFGRAVLSAEGLSNWLKKGARGEAIVELIAADESPTHVLLKGLRLANSVEGVWYLAVRDLSDDYRRTSMDRADTREHALRAIWDATSRATMDSMEAMLAATRLLTSDAKQTTDRDTMLTRVNSLRQHAGGLDGYLRTIRWLNLALWSELPKPMITEFQAVEPVRAAVDQMAPRFKSRNVTVSVNDQGGWVCGDEEWLRTALLGILYHAAESVSDASVGVHLKRLPPAPGATEERVAFEVLDAGSPLSASQLADLESPFGGINTPSFLSSEASGYMPGLILGADLAHRMNGTLEFDTTPGGGLIVRFVVPTRAVTAIIAEPAPEPTDIGILEELVMGWKLGTA